MQDGRPRRTIKARIRFDDEDYQSPSNLSAKSLPTPAPTPTTTSATSTTTTTTTATATTTTTTTTITSDLPSEPVTVAPKKEPTITPKREPNITPKRVPPTKGGLKVKLPSSSKSSITPIISVTLPDKKIDPPPKISPTTISASPIEKKPLIDQQSRPTRPHTPPEKLKGLYEIPPLHKINKSSLSDKKKDSSDKKKDHITKSNNELTTKSKVSIPDPKLKPTTSIEAKTHKITKPKVSPEKPKPIIQKARPPRPRTPPIDLNVVINTRLPFYDALDVRTAADTQEDDNVKELVHCQCEMQEECGLMVQCETCLTWQHNHCLQIDKPEDVDNYICSTCSNPRLARDSQRFAYDQEWLVKGKFKTLSQEQSEESKNTMLQTNKCLEEVLEIARIMQSLKIKLKILLAKDHAALKLWDRSNVVDFEDLHAHILQIGDQVDTKLISLDERVTKLESIVGVEEDDNLKKSIESLKIDLSTLKELTAITP